MPMVEGSCASQGPSTLRCPSPKCGEDADPIRAVRRLIRATAAGPGSCWRQSRAKAFAVGPGPDGDPRERASPSARACRRQNLIHVEARDARDALWAMEEGVRCSCLSAVIGELWGDPARARLHRDPAAGGRGGAQRNAVLAGAAWRHREPQRRADALADCDARRRWRTISTRARRERRHGMPSCSARVGIRRGGGTSRMKRIASIWLPRLAIERWAKSERLRA